MFYRPNPVLPCRIGPNYNFPDFQSFFVQETTQKEIRIAGVTSRHSQLTAPAQYIMRFSGRCVMQHSDIVLAGLETTGRISQLHASLRFIYCTRLTFSLSATTFHLSSDRQFKLHVKFHGATQPSHIEFCRKTYNWMRSISSKVNGRIRHLPSPSIKMKLTD